MRLLLVSDVTGPGGVDTYVVALATAAAQRGFRVSALINEETSVDSLANTLKSCGIQVHRGRLYHRAHTEREQRAAIDRALELCCPQVVHVACGVPWSCLAVRERIVEHHIPLVFTEQYVAPGFEISPDMHARVANLYRRAAGVVCVCEENKELIQNRYGWPSDKAVVIPNAVRISRDLPVRFHRRVGDELRVATVARLVQQKGIDTLIDAATRLPIELRTRLRITVFGDGPLLQRLQKSASDAGLSDRIEFRGWCKEAVALIGKFDLFVLPSRSEGQPFALLEAMAAGVPVIASAVSGIPEALEQGRSGLLVTPGDSDALAQAIAWADSNPASADALAKRAFKHIQREHSIDWAVARHIELWRTSMVAPVLPYAVSERVMQ